nr:hypothetical protein [Actinomycetales bacterium]
MKRRREIISPTQPPSPSALNSGSSPAIPGGGPVVPGSGPVVPGSYSGPRAGSSPAIPGSYSGPPAGIPGGYSPRNPAPRSMRAGIWSLLADTLFGVVALTVATTYWGSIFGTTPTTTVPLMAATLVGLIWARGAGSRGPIHVALPAALVLLAVILTNGNGLVSLLPDAAHPLVATSRVGGVIFGSTGLLFAALSTVVLAA